MSPRQRLLLAYLLIALVTGLACLAGAGRAGVHTAGSLLLLAPFVVVPPLALGVVVYLLLSRMAGRVEAIADAAERVADGSPGAALPSARDEDEVARLVSAVERLRNVLVARIAELDRERDTLLSVVGRMKEALVLVGADQRVQLANDMFRSICSVRSDPVGRPLAEVIRYPAVTSAVGRALHDGEEVTVTYAEPVAAGRSFELHVTPLRSNGTRGGSGAIALFYDITRLEALEGVRREFVANVTHELRTPLTSIKASVETLLDDALSETEVGGRFLGIARRQVERMEALLSDLTDLSLIETGAIQLDPQSFDAAVLVREVLSQFTQAAAAAKVDLSVDMPTPFLLTADRRRIEQVLVNLVDNAVKFNRPGGAVEVRGRRVDGHPVVTVEDSGVGIPAGSLEKIFHRFYRVDPAEGQERTGTGLGLSIVKHLMRLHGGQVRVESELGRGSRFVLEF